MESPVIYTEDHIYKITQLFRYDITKANFLINLKDVEGKLLPYVYGQNQNTWGFVVDKGKSHVHKHSYLED